MIHILKLLCLSFILGFVIHGIAVKAQVITSPPATEGIFNEPVSLIIPNLHINTALEPVGIDQSGRMDVPKDPNNVGWYYYGGKPRDQKNMVLAGHYDSSQGPAVFYHLDRLRPGDRISIGNSNGETYDYTVTWKQQYPLHTFPMRFIFDSSGSHLILITCDGLFDQKKREYSHRLVVFASPLVRSKADSI